MVNYGSTVRIAILPRDSNDPLYAIPVTLADTYAAHDAIKHGSEKVRDWLYKEATVLKKFQDVSDDQIIALAKARGLTVDSPKTIFPDLYFYKSRSGNTNGHYIEQYETSIDCTCPGFQNRRRCWATDQVISGNGYANKWVSTTEAFYNSRKWAYSDY